MARDVIKHNPLTPELSAKLFAQKGISAFRFSAALIEWSQSELAVPLEILKFEAASIIRILSKRSLAAKINKNAGDTSGTVARVLALNAFCVRVPCPWLRVPFLFSTEAYKEPDSSGATLRPL
jgi:hypothetical protein